jgi:hypothetical protein
MTTDIGEALKGGLVRRFEWRIDDEDEFCVDRLTGREVVRYDLGDPANCIVDPDSYDGNLLTALRAAQARADAAEARVRELEDIRPNYTDEDYRRLNRAHCRTEERRAALEARVRELEEGLRPFAAIGADVSPMLADRAPYSTGRASVGDFRRVHALLDKLSKATPSEEVAST